VPSISVIIPAYNRARWLPETVARCMLPVSFPSHSCEAFTD
jgi:GT2 family glycosyltransferase